MASFSDAMIAFEGASLLCLPAPGARDEPRVTWSKMLGEEEEEGERSKRGRASEPSPN